MEKVDKTDDEYEKMLQERKQQHRLKRNESFKSNYFLDRIKGYVKNLVKFFYTIHKILCIFFKSLLGVFQKSDNYTGKYDNGDDDNFPPKRMQDLNTSRQMDLKNLGACLGSS